MATAGFKALVIVESPAKATKIASFLGNSYVVESSRGHVADLPTGASEVPDPYYTRDFDGALDLVEACAEGLARALARS